jgi:hypothetical protein
MPVTSITLNVDQLAEIRDVVNVALGRSVEFDTVSTDGTTLLQRLECDISGNAATATTATKYAVTNSPDASIEDALGLKADLSAMNTALVAKLDAPGTVLYHDGFKQFGDVILGTEPNGYLGWSVSLSADGTIVAIGMPGSNQNNSQLTNEGKVGVFELKNGLWTQKGNFIYGTHSSSATVSGTGRSVSISDNGSRLAVGTPCAGYTHHGMVTVYEYDNDEEDWKRMGLDLMGDPNAEFGHAVSLSGDGSTLVAGAADNYRVTFYEANPVTDYVKVYIWDGSSWQQHGTPFVGSDNNDNTGYSVSLSYDGTIVAIGAKNVNNDAGSSAGETKVYKKTTTATGWDVIGTFPGEAGQDENGFSVSLSADGKRVAIAAVSGVCVYEYYSGSVWSKLGTNLSGGSVSLSADGNTLAIGSSYARDASDLPKGHVRIYTYAPTTAWTQLGKAIDGQSSNGQFGKDVSLSADGTTLAVGAPREDWAVYEQSSYIVDRGRVRIFRFYEEALDITAGAASGATGPLATTINTKLDADVAAVNSLVTNEQLDCNISGRVWDATGALHQMGMLKLTHSDWSLSNFNPDWNDGVVSNQPGSQTYYLDYWGAGSNTQGFNYNYNTNPPMYASGIALNTQDGGTVTAVVITHSDSRIKMNIEDVPDAVALEQVRQIPCRYYEYKNKIQRGYGKTIGFIAQEVKEVLPMAVKLTTGVIPDHMRPAEVSWEEVDGKHMMTVSNLDADVSSGMKMEFVGRTGTPTERNEDGSVKTPASEDYRECNEVVVMRDNGKFEMKKQYDAVFIIGREVNDKHSVDKAKIFALHHAAIQELDKTVEAQKATIAAQAQELSEQKALIQSLIARMDALEA